MIQAEVHRNLLRVAHHRNPLQVVHHRKMLQVVGHSPNSILQVLEKN